MVAFPLVLQGLSFQQNGSSLKKQNQKKPDTREEGKFWGNNFLLSSRGEGLFDPSWDIIHLNIFIDT